MLTGTRKYDTGRYYKLATDNDENDDNEYIPYYIALPARRIIPVIKRRYTNYHYLIVPYRYTIILSF